jgi:hypothetical protein
MGIGALEPTGGNEPTARPWAKVAAENWNSKSKLSPKFYVAHDAARRGNGNRKRMYRKRNSNSKGGPKSPGRVL